MTDATAVLAALDTVRDPELDESVTSLGFVTSCTVSADGVADVRLRSAHLLLCAQLRLPDGGGCVRGGQRRGRASSGHRSCWRTTSPPTRSTAGWPRSPASSSRSTGSRRRSCRSCAPTSGARRRLAATDRVCRPLLAAGRTPEELAGHDPRRRPGVAGSGAPALSARRAGTAGRRRLGAAGGPGHRRGGGGAGIAIAPASGEADRGQPGGQRRRLPGPAAREIRDRRTRRGGKTL